MFRTSLRRGAQVVAAASANARLPPAADTKRESDQVKADNPQFLHAASRRSSPCSELNFSSHASTPSGKFSRACSPNHKLAASSYATAAALSSRNRPSQRHFPSTVILARHLFVHVSQNTPLNLDVQGWPRMVFIFRAFRVRCVTVRITRFSLRQSSASPLRWPTCRFVSPIPRTSRRNGTFLPSAE